MHVFTTVKGVTKTDILCAVMNTMHSRKNMQTCFKLDENGKKTKQKIQNLFGFYSTRKWVLKAQHDSL